MKKRKLAFYYFLISAIYISIYIVLFTVTRFLYNGKAEIEMNESVTKKIVIANARDYDDSTIHQKNITDLRDYYSNDDIKARIIIESLDIDNVVLQSSDNEFYLKRNAYKRYSALGSIFLDYRTDIKDSKQINIYGHNSHYYDIPFSRLDAYLSYDFYEDNKYIYLETENGLYTYEIFAVYGIYRENNEHMLVDFDDCEEWNDHFNSMKNKSIYDTGVSVNGNDTVLVLQTCLYDTSYGKYLIINAKKI